ncbi:uncharacterized protein LOC144314168 isoform X2 [Canis aureus]
MHLPVKFETVGLCCVRYSTQEASVTATGFALEAISSPLSAQVVLACTASRSCYQSFWLRVLLLFKWMLNIGQNLCKLRSESSNILKRI